MKKRKKRKRKKEKKNTMEKKTTGIYILKIRNGNDELYNYWRIGGKKRKEFIENSMINKNLLSICRIKKIPSVEKRGWKKEETEEENKND